MVGDANGRVGETSRITVNEWELGQLNKMYDKRKLHNWRSVFKKYFKPKYIRKFTSVSAIDEERGNNILHSSVKIGSNSVVPDCFLGGSQKKKKKRLKKGYQKWN